MHNPESNMQVYFILCAVIVLSVSSSESGRYEVPYNSAVASNVSTQTTGTMGRMLREIESLSVPNNDETSSPVNENNVPSGQSDDCICSYFDPNSKRNVLVNGKNFQSGFQLRKGETAVFSCKNASMHLVWTNGASLSKSSNLTCNKCRNWTVNDIPSCLYSSLDLNIHCTRFSDIPYDLTVDYEDPDTGVGSRAIFSCKNPIIETKTLDGEKVAVCLRSGEWSSTPPKCTFIQCPRFADKVMDSLNIQYESADLHVGSIVKFSCRKNYQRVEGNTVAVCRESGKWSSPPPGCINIYCTRFPDKYMNQLIIHYEGNDTRVGSVAYFSCRKTNQKLNGVRSTFCLKSGKWASQPPECKGTVEEPASSTTASRVHTQARNTTWPISNYTTPKPPSIENIYTRQPKNCICAYFHRDLNLIAEADGRIEKFAIRLKKGQSAMLYCGKPDMYLVWPNVAFTAKSVNLTCDECQKWHATEIPSCQANRKSHELRV